MRRMKNSCFLVGMVSAVFFGTASASAGVLEVGPGKAYATPSAAFGAARDGDTIVIAEGVYNDVCYCPATPNLTVRGAGINKTVIDGSTFNAPSYAQGGPHIAGWKGLWVVTAEGWTIEDVTFRNARIPADAGGNGAGLRYEADGDVTIRRCSFTGNQNGILCGALPHATMTIEASEFHDNGNHAEWGGEEGYTHNLYIGVIKELIFRSCISDHAYRGHDLKSRALKTVIENCVFDDGHDGQASYLVNCPQGGDVTITGCTFVQSEVSTNARMISIADGDGARHPGSVVYAENNTFTNYRHSCVEMFVGSGVPILKLSDRIEDEPFAGEVTGGAWTYGTYDPDAWRPCGVNLLAGATAVTNRLFAWNGDDKVTLKNPFGALTDGSVPCSDDSSLNYDTIYAFSGGRAFWTLPAPSVLKMVRISSRWRDGGRDGIDIKGVYARRASDNGLVVVSTNAVPYGTDGADGSNNSSGHLMAVLARPDGQALISDITQIVIEFNGGQDNGGTGFVEIEAVAEVAGGDGIYPVEDDKPVRGEWSYGSYEPSSWRPSTRNALLGKTAQIGGGLYSGDQQPGNDVALLTDGRIPADGNLAGVVGLADSSSLTYAFDSENVKAVTIYSLWKDGEHDGMYVRGLDLQVGGNWVCIAGDDINANPTGVPRGDCGRMGYDDASGWSSAVKLGGNGSSGHLFLRFAAPDDKCLAKKVTGLRIRFRQLDNGGTGFAEIEMEGETDQGGGSAADDDADPVFPETAWTSGDYDPASWCRSVDNVLAGRVSSSRPATYDWDNGRGDYANDLASLTDGKIPAAMNTTDVFAIKSGTLEYMLAKPETVKEIRFNSLWWDGGRDAMKVGAVSVKVGSQDAPWRTLAENGVSVGFNDNNSSGAIFLKLAAKDGGKLASNVVAIRFDFPDEQDNAGTGFAEIEVIRVSAGTRTSTALTEVPVPYAWLDEFYPNRCASADDYEALAAGNGANGCPVWESYLVGLDPTDAASQLTVTIRMEGDTPVIEWKTARQQNLEALGYSCRVKGKANLSDPVWSEGVSGHRFFKVFIERN